MRQSVVLSLLLLLFACKSQERMGENDVFPANYDLAATMIGDELIADLPNIKMLGDDMLITSSVNNVHTGIIKIFSAGDGFREILSYGSRGRGPKEFITPLLSSVDGNEVFVHNLNLSEIATLDVSSGGDTIREIGRKPFQYNEQAKEKFPEDFIRVEPRDAVKLKSGNWVGVSALGANAFYSLWDANLNFITYFGDAPIPEEYDFLSGRNFLAGNLAAMDDSFVFGCYNFPYLAMYDVKNGEPKKKWDKYFVQPNYRVENGKISFSKKHFGLDIAVAMGREYIYVAFIGEYAEKWQTPEMSFTSNQILVFDHDGKPVASLNLDQRVHSIAVSPDEKTLYAVAVMPEYRIAEYKLPDF